MAVMCGCSTKSSSGSGASPLRTSTTRRLAPGGGGRVARQREKIRGSSRTASPAGKGTCRVGPTLDFAGCPTRRARNLRTLVPGFTGCKIDLGIASPFRMWETMLGGMGDIKPA